MFSKVKRGFYYVHNLRVRAAHASHQVMFEHFVLDAFLSHQEYQNIRAIYRKFYRI
jgi:hypothetical protein